MYSASDELKTIIVCRVDELETGAPLMVTYVPDFEHRVTLQSVQSACSYAVGGLLLMADRGKNVSFPSSMICFPPPTWSELSIGVS